MNPQQREETEGRKSAFEMAAERSEKIAEHYANLAETPEPEDVEFKGGIGFRPNREAYAATAAHHSSLAAEYRASARLLTALLEEEPHT